MTRTVSIDPPGTGSLTGDHIDRGGLSDSRLSSLSMEPAVRKLDLEVGELIEIDGRRYEVVPDHMGGVTIEPPTTPIAEIEAAHGR